jgi:hypothetical protein
VISLTGINQKKIDARLGTGLHGKAVEPKMRLVNRSVLTMKKILLLFWTITT